MLTAARAGRPSGGGTEQVREFLMLLKLSSELRTICQVKHPRGS